MPKYTRRIGFTLAVVIPTIGASLWFAGRDGGEVDRLTKPQKVSGAMSALQSWSAQRMLCEEGWIDASADPWEMNS